MIRLKTSVVVSFLSLTLAVTVIATVFVYRTAKSAVAKIYRNVTGVTQVQPMAMAEQMAVTASADPASEPVVMGAAMAGAFHSGHLPSPLSQPTGSPDKAAAELAKRIMAEDDQSTGALLTALQMSGFSVRAEDGSIAVASVKPGQGIVFDAWETAAMAKLFGDGMQIRLVDLSNALAGSLSPLKGVPLPELFLDGLRSAAQGGDPAKRFWALFIAELGRQSAKPYDLLMQDTDPASINLDAIQALMILRRLTTDLMIVNGKKGQEAGLMPAWKSETYSGSLRTQPTSCSFEGRRNLFIRDAVWRPKASPRLTLVQERTESKLPCTLSELESQIMDSSAYLSGKGFDTLIEYLDEHGMKGAGLYGKLTSTLINPLLAIIKLIAYYACLDTNITMSGNPPLVRTQSSTSPGERRTLTATVKENVGNWQALNCLRIALNGAGLDLNLPNDGPVAGAEIQWVLVGGGVSISHDTGEITWPIVEFVSPNGTPTVQDAVDTSTSNFTSPKTAETGHATIDIEGTRQRQVLGRPSPIMKQAEVRFTVAPKPIGMSQDIIDAVGNGYLAGAFGAAIGAPVEILLRSNIHFSNSLIIPVKDWIASGAWSGTVTVTFTGNASDSNAGTNATELETATYSLTGDLDDKSTPDVVVEKASESDSVKYTFTQDKSFPGHDGDCIHIGLPGTIPSEEEHGRTEGEGAGQGSAMIAIYSGQLSKYHLEVIEPMSPLPLYKERFSKHDTWKRCGAEKVDDSHNERQWTYPPLSFNFDASADPRNPNVIQGETSTKTFSPWQIPGDLTVKWQLQRR